MKKCSRCCLEKDTTLFSKKNASSDGFKSHCKECEKLDRIKNFERDKALKAKWVQNNKQRHVSVNAKYREAHKDRLLEWNRNYKRKYESNKLNSDIQHRLRNRLRARLHSIKISNKSTIDYLGCSLECFKLYIESLWKPGMNWNNWSRSGWHIDHIKPLKSFDLTDPEQIKIACHYTNLQPLWAKENLKKSSKV